MLSPLTQCFRFNVVSLTFDQACVDQAVLGLFVMISQLMPRQLTVSASCVWQTDFV